MQHDAGGVDDAAQFGPVLAFQSLGHAGGDGLGVGLAVDGRALADVFAQVGEFVADGGDDAFVGVPSPPAAQRFGGENVVDGGQVAKGVFAHGHCRGSPLR